MTRRHLHRFGGVDLLRQHREWSGISVDRVMWRATPGSTGEIHKPVHQIFVSLHGSAGRTLARAADGSRYTGHDFPGAVTFVPAGCHRVTRYDGGTLSYLGITIPAGQYPAAEPLRPFTHEADPLVREIAHTLLGVVPVGAGVFRACPVELRWGFAAHWHDPQDRP